MFIPFYPITEKKEQERTPCVFCCNHTQVYGSFVARPQQLENCLWLAGLNIFLFYYIKTRTRAVCCKDENTASNSVRYVFWLEKLSLFTLKVIGNLGIHSAGPIFPHANSAAVLSTARELRR